MVKCHTVIKLLFWKEHRNIMRYKEFVIEGRNAVLEAFRAGKTIDKLFVLDGCHDGPAMSITRESKKKNTVIHYIDRDRLDGMAPPGKH